MEVCLLHDNARPHIASATYRQLVSMGWNTIPHPPYSPDLAPSDFHLFHSFKEHLRGHNFRDFDHLESELARFFEGQSADFLGARHPSSAGALGACDKFGRRSHR